MHPWGPIGGTSVSRPWKGLGGRLRRSPGPARTQLLPRSSAISLASRAVISGLLHAGDQRVLEQGLVELLVRRYRAAPTTGLLVAVTVDGDLGTGERVDARRWGGNMTISKRWWHLNRMQSSTVAERHGDL